MNDNDKKSLDKFRENVNKVREASRLLNEAREYMVDAGCVIGEMEQALATATKFCEKFVRASDKAIKQIEKEYKDPQKFMSTVVDSIEDILLNGSDDDVANLLKLF